MSEERNQAPIEPYSTKLVKHAVKRTWEFSKSQLIVSGALAIASVPVGYLFGLVTSVGSGILAVLLVYIGAMFLVALFNFLHAPAVIHQEQERELIRLRQHLPTTAPQQIPAPTPQPEARPNIICTRVGATLVSIDDEDIVRVGDDHLAMIVEFVNQPRPDRRIESVDYVFATITFFDPDGTQRQHVNHGTWLEEEWREVSFSIGGMRRLVIAVQVIEGETFKPEMEAIRAIDNNRANWNESNAPDYLYFPHTVTRAIVQLFSSEDGAMVGEFAFQLNFAEQWAVSIAEAPSS
jgi:hypothetical protein